jgi:RNA polymerase sigma-70 factor (ECF subfamily)
LLEFAESPPVDEQELCERARTGSRIALGQLLEKHGSRLYRSVLLPRLGSVDAAEEALAITYSKVVERFSQFEWQAVGVYPWLRMVAMHVAIDMLRARKREVLFEPSDLERELDLGQRSDTSADQLEEHDLAVARQRVAVLLDQLHPRYAEAIRLRVLEARSREDAAQKLGVTVGTFDVVMHRALGALRKVLALSQKEGA